MLFVKVIFNLHVHCGKIIHSLKYHFGAIEKRKRKENQCQDFRNRLEEKKYVILNSQFKNDQRSYLRKEQRLDLG